MSKLTTIIRIVFAVACIIADGVLTFITFGMNTAHE